MLRFVKHYMETITGISIYPIISFLIFFTFFVLMLVYIFKVDKKKIKYLSSLPLDLETSNNADHDQEK